VAKSPEQRLDALEKQLDEVLRLLKSGNVPVHTGTQRRSWWARLWRRDAQPMRMQSLAAVDDAQVQSQAPQQVRHTWQMRDNVAREVWGIIANIVTPVGQGAIIGAMTGGAVWFLSTKSALVTPDHAEAIAVIAGMATTGYFFFRADGNKRIYAQEQSGQLSRLRKNEPVTIAEVRHTNERGALAQLSRLIVPAHVARDVPPKKLREFCAYAAQGRDLGVHTITALFMKRSAWLAIRDQMLIHGLLVERNRAGAVMLTRAGAEWCRRAASGKPKRRLVARILQ
jgi:hypothetical protein